MSEPLTWALSAVIGLGLGVLFFGGLWWTIRRGLSSAHPTRLFLTSLLLRMGVTLAGFYWVADGQWQQLLACLLGFMLARLILLRIIGPVQQSSIQESSHAP